MSTSPVEGRVGVEPTVLGLKIRCSSDKLTARMVWPGSQATFPTVFQFYFLTHMIGVSWGDQLSKSAGMHRTAPSFLMRNLRLEERPGRVETYQEGERRDR